MAYKGSRFHVHDLRNGLTGPVPALTLFESFVFCSEASATTPSLPLFVRIFAPSRFLVRELLRTPAIF